MERQPLTFPGYEGEPAPAGSLRLPTGRVVAMDPNVLAAGRPPFTVTVPPGTYPVTVMLATIGGDPGHRRVSVVRLEVTGAPVVRWEMALRAGEALTDLGDQQFFGFGVDGGTACFVDAANITPLAEAEVWWKVIDMLNAHPAPAYGVAADGDLVAWESGWGDGWYPVWIGRSADGAVACFLADMLLQV